MRNAGLDELQAGNKTGETSMTCDMLMILL